MPRYKLTIEYDGGPFVGWQVQGSGPSVQGLLMAAATIAVGGNTPPDVEASGRSHRGLGW